MSEESDLARLASAYGELLTLLVESPALGAVLDKMVRLASGVISSAAACAVALCHDGPPFTPATSDDLAARMDEVQYTSAEGPSLESMRHAAVVQVDDLTAERRWDSFRPHAIAHGVLSSLSLPLTVDGDTLGALNLYSRDQSAFAGPHRRRAEAFAAQCAAALAVSLRQAHQGRVQHQLSEAMASRGVIDQAIGILMAQQRCNAGTALDLLRTASQHRNRKLREVAIEIVTNVSGEAPQRRPGFRTAPAEA